jgi:hypothetical protein
MACASQPSFYSFHSSAFVRLEQTPMRKQLVGTWRGNDGRQLALSPDGEYSAGTSSGCWDVDGSKLLLRSACVNYGILALAETTDQCSFTLRLDLLVTRDCNYAGWYRR